MKTAQLQMPPQNNRHWYLLATAVIFIFILYVLGQGCGSINRATQQVLTNAPAFNKVGAEWAKLNPCVTDSVKTIVHDTTVKTDTAYKFLPGAPLAQSPAATLINAEGAVKPPVTQWGYITKTITLHDSVKIVAVDKRQLAMCNDSMAYYKVLFAGYKEQTTQQISSWKHKARTRLWVIIAMLAVLAAYVFRRPLLQLITGGLAQWIPKK